MKHKITLNLENEELKTLADLLKNDPSGKLNHIMNDVLEQQDKKQWTKRKVVGVIAEISGFESEEISRSSHLKNDLGMGKYHRRALKSAFQKIADQGGSNKTIQVKDCENLETVNDCIQLLV